MNYLNFDFASVLSYVYNILAGIIGILLIVARWMLFEKAGEQGWASIIPFYNRYCLFKVAKRTELFWWWLGAQVASIIAYVVVVVDFVMMLIHGLGRIGGRSYGSAAYGRDMVILIIFLIFMLLTGIANIVFNAILCGGLAEVFGKTTGFAVGLFFLPFVFYCILAFSSEIRYVGVEPEAYGAQGYDSYEGQGYGVYGVQTQGYEVYGRQNYETYGQQDNGIYDQQNYGTYGQQDNGIYGQQGNGIYDQQNYEAYGQKIYNTNAAQSNIVNDSQTNAVQNNTVNDSQTNANQGQWQNSNAYGTQTYDINGQQNKNDYEF